LDAARYILKNRRARCVFEWARGHAKSSHISLLIPLWLKIQPNFEATEGQMPMVLILMSRSQDMAIRLLSDLQGELQYNPLYISDFGKQVKEGSWESGEFKTRDGCMFIAAGRDQPPRGLKERGVRPNYIVVDDIDDDEICRNPKRVQMAADKLLTALFGTMEMGRGRFICVGNQIARTSILNIIKDRPGFYHTVVNALDRNGRPSWPENYRIEEIQQLRSQIGERNFQKEYMNNPINEGTVFERKYIRYGKMLPLRYYRGLVCYTDPSFKDSTKNDYKATLLVGITKEGVYHVLKAYVDQTSVTNMIQWHYDIHDFAKGAVVNYYMESNFIQDLILEAFRKAGVLVGWQLPIRGDSRKKPDKFARIEALQPLFERGLIVFNESERTHPGMMQLEEQLLMFEKGSRTHDDAPDALEGAVYLLNIRHKCSTAGYVVGKSRGGWKMW
jgi:predicted phage terminase large subunit-like protein